MNERCYFRLLKSTPVSVNQIIERGSFSDYEKSLMLTEDLTIVAVRTNLKLSNINVKRKFKSDIGHHSLFILMISLVLKQITILDVNFDISGHLFETYNPINANIQNLVIIADVLHAGFSFTIDCNFPEANWLNEVYFNNITVTISNLKTIRSLYEWPSIVIYQGPANFTVNNANFENFYSSYEIGKPTIFVYSSIICQPDDGIG